MVILMEIFIFSYICIDFYCISNNVTLLFEHMNIFLDYLTSMSEDEWV